MGESEQCPMLEIILSLECAKYTVAGISLLVLDVTCILDVKSCCIT